MIGGLLELGKGADGFSGDYRESLRGFEEGSRRDLGGFHEGARRYVVLWPSKTPMDYRGTQEESERVPGGL